MKTLSSSKRPHLSKLLIVSAFAVVLIGGAVFAVIANRPPDKDPNPLGTVEQEQVLNADSPSQSTLPSKNGSESETSNPQSSVETPSTPPEKPTLERAGGNPTVKVVATFQKASSGHCELQLSQPGQQTLSYTSSIIIGSSYYTCNFTVARNTLAAGSWSAIVIHHIGTASTPSDAKDVE